MKDLAQAAEAQKTLESKIIVVKSGPTGGHWRVEGMTAHMEKGKPVFFASACQKVPVSIRNFFCYLCQCLSRARLSCLLVCVTLAMCVRVFVLVFQCFLLYVRSCRLKKIYSSRLSKGVRALRRWIGTRPSEGALVDAFPGTFATCFELQPRSPLSTLVGLVEYVKVGQRIKADFRKQTRKKEFVIMRLVVSTNPESGSCALCPCPFVISVVNLPLLVLLCLLRYTVCA